MAKRGIRTSAAGLHTATLSFGYAEPLTAARFDLDSKLAFLTQARS